VTRERAERYWFGTTALCAAAGTGVSVYTAVRGPGHFSSGVARGFNTFAFFTIVSNILAGGVSLALALNPRLRSTLVATFRLGGLVMIAVTGVVYHVALSQLADLDGIAQFGNQLVHTVVPVLTVAGWLLYGPRGIAGKRVVWLSVVIPLLWLAFTLIRGAVIHWYPYPFLDVDVIGYAKAVLNIAWVALLLLGLAAGAAALDKHLPRPA
jgi:hypothetical protein